MTPQIPFAAAAVAVCSLRWFVKHNNSAKSTSQNIGGAEDPTRTNIINIRRAIGWASIKFKKVIINMLMVAVTVVGCAVLLISKDLI